MIPGFFLALDKNRETSLTQGFRALLSRKRSERLDLAYTGLIMLQAQESNYADILNK